MNEELAVLDFFSKEENLPLGLAVAAQMDTIREQKNSHFWTALQHIFNTRLQGTEWQTQVTEDRNEAGMLVGLQFALREPQTICLFPMLEQQFIGGTWRIFFGLMWQVAPSPDQLALPEIASLKQRLSDSGFKSNENFLAWQWSHFYPRRKDFLLRYAAHPEKLLNEVESTLSALLVDQRASITSANAALKGLPRSMSISLDQLRRKPAN